MIDEVDKSHGSQTEFVYLYMLVNKRYNAMLHTVLIGNADTKESIQDVIGASAYARVASEGMQIQLSGRDWRKQ